MLVEIRYNFCEPGHGKGPHDGVGATVKHGLDMLAIRDQVRLRNGYECYLAANKHLREIGKYADVDKQASYTHSNREIQYIPAKLTRNTVKDLNLKAIQGTLKTRYVQCVGDKFAVWNLSCGCQACLTMPSHETALAVCQYSKWRYFDLQSVKYATCEQVSNLILAYNVFLLFGNNFVVIT